jgi:hypothetical protein
LAKEIQAALEQAKLRPPAALAGLIGKAERLMGPAEGGVPFALAAPVGTVVLRDRPAFRWHPLPGATSYRVIVSDAAFNIVARSGSLSVTRWQVPSPLPRGKVYTWQVTALKDGKEIVSPTPPAPEAKFKVLESARASELMRAQEQFAHSPLTLGILYTRAGLLDDAEQALQTLADANPTTDVARKLLHSVQALRKSDVRPEGGAPP